MTVIKYLGIAVFLATIFICASAVPAAANYDDVTKVTSHKKVSSTAISNYTSKGIMPVDSKKVYITRGGKTFWYRFTTYKVNYRKVLTQYSTSWGRAGYMEFLRSSNGSWYKIRGGNFWVKPIYQKLGYRYNSFSYKDWLNYLHYYNRWNIVWDRTIKWPQV
jgi:hypothetical protein